MTAAEQHPWLDRLGYAREPKALHLRGQVVPGTHPYALEVRSLLRLDGAVRAQAVFDVEGVPTVVFVGDDQEPLSIDALDKIRQKIWNQNLATVVIDLAGSTARAFPAKRTHTFKELRLAEARADGPFSALDVASANLARRLPDWFDVEARVDRKLLKNLAMTISALSGKGFQGDQDPETLRPYAELLLGQVLFVSYLEHRDIVGKTYRQRRSVGRLHDLVASGNHDGIQKLVDWLRKDFNGDFLGDSSHDPWSLLNGQAYELLDHFLSRTDMTTGQGDFWNYDFSHIPVELLSGLYESFLSREEQARDSAYYTPRHLATLAVDQAFAASADPLSETIFDGACGSGILLTTAYRRLIALSEARCDRRLGFKERASLLTKHIFGADINPIACRVTAFSLYLSLLEGLDPADIISAQEHVKAKLPRLYGDNLLAGERADFFSPNHGFAEKRFSLVISNPPWKEPEGTTVTSADRWAASVDAPFVRRQIAGAYALRALDFLVDNGHLCLILPIAQFLGPTSARFVSHLLARARPIRLINFGDLQNLLFPTTEDTCHVFLSVNRGVGGQGPISFDETFDYCVPKADMSLAYGRLTVQTTDRHALQTISVVQDPQLLVTLMWGDASDLQLWTRLTAFGTFGNFCKGPKRSRRWVNRKGVRLKDKSRDSVSSAPLRDMPHISVNRLSGRSPLLSSDLLSVWPSEQQVVVGLSDDLLRVFEGPRVLFPDGFSRQDLMIRAAFLDLPASFTVSIGVIAGPKEDTSLLQFAAVYLRSDLARYFLMMRGWKMLCERNAVHLKDVMSFPFFDASDAPDPLAARTALDRTTGRLRELTQLHRFDQDQAYAELRDDFDEDVFEYFSLSNKERALVRETVNILLPSIRPRSFASLNTPAQSRATRAEFQKYGSELADALAEWRRRTGGLGQFDVAIVANGSDRPGSVGVVRIEYNPSESSPTRAVTKIDNEIIQATLAELRLSGLAAIPLGDALHLVPDIYVWTDEALYLVRPLTGRLWTRRQALRDAEHIVRAVQNRQGPLNGSDAA